MGHEYTSEQLVLIKELQKALALNEESADKTGSISIDVWNNKDDKLKVELPRKLNPGEKVYVWESTNGETGLTMVDDDWGRDVQTYFLRLKTPDMIRQEIARIYDINYTLDTDFHFPLAPYSDIPMTVVRKTVEGWYGSPTGARKQRDGGGVTVERVIYRPRTRSGQVYKPYLFVSNSRFDLAPENYPNPYGVMRQGLWVETARVYEYKGIRVDYQNYQQPQTGYLELGNQVATSVGFPVRVPSETILLHKTKPMSGV